jgi:hypothetical protein
MGSLEPIKKPGIARLSSPHAYTWRFSSRFGDDRSFHFPGSPIASEQHSSLEPAPKLALLQRSAKINVVQKQQTTVGRGAARPVNDFEYPYRDKSIKKLET